MKVLHAAMVLALLLGGGNACLTNSIGCSAAENGATAIGAMNEFKDVSGLTFKYPAAWTVQYNPDKDTLAKISGKVADTADGEISVSIVDNPMGLTVDTFERMLNDAMFSKLENVTKSDLTERFIGASGRVRAHGESIEFTIKGAPVRQDYIFIAARGKLIVFVFSSSRSLRAQLAPVWRSLVHSIDGPESLIALASPVETSMSKRDGDRVNRNDRAAEPSMHVPAHVPAPSVEVPAPVAASNGNACAVESIERLPQGGLKLWSPDGQKYLVNKPDKKGDYQIYVGGKDDLEPQCITDRNLPDGPIRERNKMQSLWHPSGKWIIFAGERFVYPEIWIPKRLRQGWLQCGIWMDIYAIRPDGSQCFRLANPKGGFTGVAFTPDGKRGVWAEAIGMIPKAVFGKWLLKMADFEERDGRPMLTNVRDITPPGAIWLEPGTFSPNGRDLALNADIGMTDAQGQDQYILNVDTLELTNLTNSPRIWDEHGVFSPDGEKLFCMSSYPYRDKPNTYKILGLKTEFMVINRDGTGLQQITHFNTPGYPESYKDGATPAVGMWSEDGREVQALVLLSGARFPDYDVWKIVFRGNCGNCKHPR